MSKTAIEAHEQNRASWNEAVVAHNSHKVDQDGFFRNKGSTLYPEEIGLLGNLAGLKVCHLQCNAGQDTLSLVTRLGAENPIGVDISDNAIEFATKLAEDTGIQATFIRADVFEFFDTTEASQFDVVFVSYGTVNWLVDLEFATFSTRTWSNTGGEVMPNLKYQEGVQDFRNPNASVEFCWGLSDTIGSLVKAGMHLTHFKEYPYSNFFRPYKAMTSEHVEEGPRWRSTGPMLPLMYSVCASKP
ncbi:hypothetical protein BGZ91_000998 [Linnemannia elongata]|nr:hypothetical protein BGZ91_000998 [Linnemannia elongata]